MSDSKTQTDQENVHDIIKLLNNPIHPIAPAKIEKLIEFTMKNKDASKDSDSGEEGGEEEEEEDTFEDLFKDQQGQLKRKYKEFAEKAVPMFQEIREQHKKLCTEYHNVRLLKELDTKQIWWQCNNCGRNFKFRKELPYRHHKDGLLRYAVEMDAWDVSKPEPVSLCGQCVEDGDILGEFYGDDEGDFA